MTVETSLQVRYGGTLYTLMVKMIRIGPASYFFIRDMGNGKPLLAGKTLELTYVDSFTLTQFAGIVKSPGIPKRVVSAIEKAILNKRENWFYE